MKRGQYSLLHCRRSEPLQTREAMVERLFLVVVLAAVLAAADLGVKATLATRQSDFHQRSGAWVALSVTELLGALALTLIASAAVAVAAGLLSGGVLGNLVSARSDSNRVPNPITIGDHITGMAFNLADVFILAGDLFLMLALITVAVRNRDRFARPRVWDRAVRDRHRS